MGILNRSSGGKVDLNTSEGLYQLAKTSGLQKRADSVLGRKGEQTNRIFSGGFISDIFDGFNALQYGITGILKGKGFAEGVRTRQSFSDKDALGEHGLPGVIGGIALDIAVDPLTYIAPWTILKKVGAIGKLKKGAQAIAKTKFGDFMGRRLVNRFGQDPIYQSLDLRRMTNIGKSGNNIAEVSKPLRYMNKTTRELLTTTNAKGQTIRKSLDEIQKLGGVKPEQLESIGYLYNNIDNLSREYVKLGLLPKSIKENLGQYLKNSFTEYETGKKIGQFSSKKMGVNIKETMTKRKDISPEVREQLGQIFDAGYLLPDTAMKMMRTIENTKFFNKVARHFSSDIAQEGFEKLPTTKRLFTTATGDKIAMLSKIKGLNKSLKPVLGELKKTFKADRKMLSEIKRVENLLGNVRGVQLEEFKKFFQEGTLSEKTTKATRKIGTLPDNLVGVAQDVKKFKNTDELFKSKTGVELERMFEEGVLERAGFNSVNDFVEHIKNPFKRTAEATRQVIIGNKVVKLKSLIKKLEGKKSIEEVKNIISKAAVKTEKLITGNISKILDVPSVGKISSLDLQKIGIKTIDDLVDVSKTGEFVEDIFDSLAKLRKLFGKNAESVVKSAEELVANNKMIDELLPVLNKLTNKEDIVKAINKQITEAIRKIGIEESKNLNKLVQLQKAIEGLSTKASKLRGIDKTSIDDSYRFLEESIARINAEKEGLIEGISKVALGELSGKYVPKPIFDSIQEITRARGGLDRKIMAGFKFGKVILNPATHARNMVSNTILNWWKLGLGPWRADIYAEAIHQVTKGGKWIDEAKQVGYNTNTMASHEITNLLLGPDSKTMASKFGNAWKKIVESTSNIYQGEENIAKMAAFIHQRKKGIGIEEAWKAAESATFNYAEVTPFIRNLRESLFGFPFITFTYKATPLAIETALKNPQRIGVFGKAKKAIENLSNTRETEKERASEPSWVKEGFYIKLPFKDQHGRSAYFDLTYILPFGDLMSGQFFEGKVSRETGLEEGIAPALASKSPFFGLVKELTGNEDFFSNKIWKDSDSTDKKLTDIFRHVSKTYLPPLLSDQIKGGYDSKGNQRPGVLERVSGASKENQRRTAFQEILRNVGLKVQPVNLSVQESFMEWEKRKALQTLLSEENQIGELSIPYVPKK